MTKPRKRETESERLSRSQMLFCVMSVVAMVITFAFSEVAIDAMSEGMRICAGTVIPSLFPFMVLSELLISSGAARIAGRYIGGIFARIFDISKEGSTALLLGLLCGFPIGSRSAILLYESGRISRGEVEHILSFCNSPSSAFLISAVGISLFGSQTLGMVMYGAHILSACAVGLFGRIYFKKAKKEKVFFSCCGDLESKREGFVGSLTRAVSGSAASMLTICAFVVFFSAVIGYLRFFAARVGMPHEVAALLFGFFEMTGGVSAAAGLDSSLSVPLAAAITGWSGLSVAFQFVGVCREHRFSLKPYFVSKLVCAALNTLFTCSLVRIFDIDVSVGEGSVYSFLLLPSSPYATASLVAFAVGALCYCRRAR